MADENKKPSVTYRVSDIDAAPILLIAALFDIISVVPLANDVNVFVAQPLLFLAFLARGVNPLGRKNWVWFLVTWIIELIPGFSIFPTFVVESMRWIAISRVEDEVKAKTGFEADSKRGRTFARQYLNQKSTQDMAKNESRKSIEAAGQRAGESGGDVGKAKTQKGKDIASARRNLDSAVRPDAGNVSSGRERFQNQTLTNAGRARARERDEALGGPQPVNDNIADKFSGIGPGTEKDAA